jgi:5-carboxymethyl-2-hydroxymuconate isomerase
MPHTILEYTASVPDQPDLQAFWDQLHRFLVEAAPCRLQDLKSRAYRCEAFRAGDGEGQLGFVHLTLLLLEGRTDETLAKVGQGALTLLQERFPEARRSGRMDLTVEIRGMRRAAYFK